MREMTSFAMHCGCCSPLIIHPTRVFYSSSARSTNGMISPTPRTKSSASRAPRVQQQQRQSDPGKGEHDHVQRRSAKGLRSEEVSEISSPPASDASSSSSASCMYHRRDIFHLAVGAAVMGTQLMVGGWEEVAASTAEGETAIPASPPTKPVVSDGKVDTTITDKVYLDLSICPSASRSDRTLGNTSQLCTVGEPLGRIVIGLYGRLVPQTVQNFKAMITGAVGTSYAGTIFHRVLAGQYIQGGRQGSKEKGEVSAPLYKLESNTETVSAKSYKLSHTRPGTVSLALADNDDDEDLKLDVDYRNVQFLITTGPGPVPQLDNRNIVFGTVLEGLDVVAAVANVPTYRPSDNIRQFNDFASFLGDERAANARNFWDRPLKSVVITSCGEIPLGLPVFPPGLP